MTGSGSSYVVTLNSNAASSYGTLSFTIPAGAATNYGASSVATTSSTFTVDKVQGAPTSVAGTAGNTQVSLAWTAPASNGGSAVSDYAIRYSGDNGLTWTVFNDSVSTLTSATVTGLTNGTGYIFQVAAVNGAGTGSWSTSSAVVTPQVPFVSRWKTDNAGTSSSTQVKLPLVSSVTTYNFRVDWGDGLSDTITSWNQAQTTHTYSVAGTYTISIYGTIPGWQFNNAGDKSKILEISSWGPFKFGNTGGQFAGANNLTITATDVPDMTGATNMSR
ncbi:fibronectin type III domain-containing protein [bacterium]|nr:fibronectin type III domain-containing protein [bacterium]